MCLKSALILPSIKPFIVICRTKGWVIVRCDAMFLTWDARQRESHAQYFCSISWVKKIVPYLTFFVAAFVGVSINITTNHVLVVRKR